MTQPSLSLRAGRPVVGTSRPPGLTRVLDLLARIPLPVALALLVLSGLLVEATNFLFPRGLVLSDWAFRNTLGWYAVLSPLGMIALWAPRRHRQGRLGYVAATVAGLAMLVNLAVMAASVIWDPVLGRGELAYPFWLLLVVASLGWLTDLLFPLTWILDRRFPRLIGPLALIGSASTFVTVGVLTAAMLAITVIALRTGLERRDLPGRTDPE